MSRGNKKIILVGGSMESKLALDYVAKMIHRLDSSYEVSTYTQGFAMSNKHQINEAAKGNLLITHSSGAMVIERGAEPSRAVFITPSQPVARRKMVVRAALKTFAHLTDAITSSKRSKYVRILLSGALELLFHPLQNFKPFLSGDISRFDLRKVLPGHSLVEDGKVKIIISSRDEMFTRGENIFEDLRQKGVKVVEIDAKHDDLFIDTERIVKEALKL